MTTLDSKAKRLAVVLIGHGAPATDCPPQLIGELMSLEWRPLDSSQARDDEGRPGGPNHSHHGAGRARELDATIRHWPRHAGNDPYKAGLERLAESLKPLLPTELFAIGYNEFCRPSIAEAIGQVVQQGATHVVVIPSMLTPGGVHAELDIPRALAEARVAHPGVVIDYVWPFDLGQVAALLAAHITRATAIAA